MTKHESAVIGAYTGILCGPFDILHAYIEKIMERPVFTHELASEEICETIKHRAKEDFIKIIENLTD